MSKATEKDKLQRAISLVEDRALYIGVEAKRVMDPEKKAALEREVVRLVNIIRALRRLDDSSDDRN